jgi:transposase
MHYQRHSNQFKEAVLNKLSQSDLSTSQFPQQEGINISTLYSWQNRFNTSGFSVSKVSSPDNFFSEEKFSVVLETSTLTEIELSECCRTKCLYPEQIKA